MKISIITISYNQAEFLEKAISSVIKQDYNDVEYIVVDPGSSDGSRDIIEKYENNIDKIIFEPDEGPADGLNKGFKNATGDIFGYINSDDYFELGVFSYVAEYFKWNPEIDVLCGAIKQVNRWQVPYIRKRTSDKFNLKKYMAGCCMIGQQATFFRKKAFWVCGGFNINNHTCWDSELLVDMALVGCTFSTTFKILGNFRIHERSISSSKKLMEQYKRDCSRIKEKITQSGIVPYPKRMEIFQRILYKINILRHISYYCVK